MDNPYQAPNKEHEKEEYIKLIGITLKKKNYILLQFLIIILCFITGVFFKFFMQEKFLNFKPDTIAIVAFILIPVEIIETLYALNKKTFTK